jgi:hypothetical protein
MMILTSESVASIMAMIASHDLDKSDIQYSLNNTPDSQNRDKELTADARSTVKRSPCPYLFQILKAVDYPSVIEKRQLKSYEDVFWELFTW